MNNPFVRIAVKLFLTGIPIYLVLIFYVVSDPYRVIYNYDCCLSYIPPPVGLNKEHLTIECYERNNPVYHYDSFIFGDSRAMIYRVNDWKEFLAGNPSCFHFDAPSETIYGIDKKVLFLDKQKVPIKNALLTLDHGTLYTVTNIQAHMYIEHPLLSGESMIAYHFQFVADFFDYNFLFPYIDLKLSGKLKPYMLNSIIFTDLRFGFDCTKNENSYTKSDSLLAKDPALFYTADRINKYFDERRPATQQYKPVIITTKQTAMLNQIKDIFDKDHTNYKVIINPGYDQLKLNPKDISVLKQIFGADNVYDFAGINNTISYYNIV